MIRRLASVFRGGRPPHDGQPASAVRLRTLLAGRAAVASLAVTVALVAGGVGGHALYANRAGSGGEGAASPTAAPATTPRPTAATVASDAAAETLKVPADGGRNIVKVVNHGDSKLRARGRLQLNGIPGDTAAPENFAGAYSSCSDCQTLAVALQIDLISKTAHTVAPQNLAVAVNYQCHRCVTVAVAYQYVLSVDNPKESTKEVRKIAHDLNRELSVINGSPDMTLSQAIDRVNAVIAQYNDLTSSLSKQQQSATDDTTPGATPLPSSTPNPGSTATPAAASPSASPSATPTASPSPSASP